MLSGYAGKMGWVDLNRRTTRTEELDESTARNYLGERKAGGCICRAAIGSTIGFIGFSFFSERVGFF